MLKKIMVGAGAAGVLSAGVIIGGLTTGFVGAQTPHPPSPQAQGSPAGAPEAPEAAEQDAPAALPAGSITADQAKQAATAYVQQTAPYSTQSLQVGSVSIDEENGTTVYKVTFTSGGGPGVEVTESTQGQVLKAESDGPDAKEQGSSDAETPGASELDNADGPGGHADAPGTTDSQGGAQQ